MVDTQRNKLMDQLTSLLDDEWIEDRARQFGVIKRQRKIDPVSLVWTLSLGFKDGERRSFASLRRRFMDIARMTIASSSWRDRFTPALARLMRACALHAMTRLAAHYRGELGGTLQRFQEILALDATVVRLVSALADTYPATRTNHTRAAAKLHVVINVLDFSTRKVKIRAEKESDQAAFKRLGDWVCNRLLMFDLGYYSFNFFRRIERRGGYFLTRLKSNANPTVVEVHDHGPGRRRDLTGLGLQEALDGLQRQIVEVTARFNVRKRAYCGRRSTTQCDWRVIAIRNDETGEYHVYVTNVPASVLSAAEVGEMYRLRWQVEIFFKMLKSYGRIHHLDTSNEAAVRALIWAGILAVIASMKILQLVRQLQPDRYCPAQRFATLFRDDARDLLKEIGRRRHPVALASRMERLLYESTDPNRSRASPLRALASA